MSEYPKANTTDGPAAPVSALQSLLSRAPTPALVAYASLVAFLTYFCMYAFRKPFAAGTFEGLTLLGTHVELKTALVISQIIGYTVSKYIGIKVCSEVTPQRRALLLVVLIVWAEAALVMFALVPGAWKCVAIFLNGLPLGMVWGLVVWYLEGRRASEVMLAVLSCSFIVSSGFVKDFGRWMMNDWSVSETWMPAVVGVIFLPLFLLSVWLLDQVPPPTTADELARTARRPMGSSDRWEFVRRFFWGLLPLAIGCFFLIAYRDFRDNYQVEIFNGLGFPYETNKLIITRAETIVAFSVMAAMGLLFLIRDNRLGLFGALAIMTSGLILMGASTLLLDIGVIDGFWWMTLVGLGAYLAYVPFGSVLFDRLMASTRTTGTAVFAIYVTDAVGYTGSVGMQLYKDLGHHDVSRLEFFLAFTWFMSVLGSVLLIASCAYFMGWVKYVPHAQPAPSQSL